MLLRITLVLALLGGAALAQQPAPPGQSLAEAAAKRFPQPVRVGDLIHRTVLQPLESQPVLGHVAAVVRQGDGMVSVVVNYGGLFGIGARPIAVPVEAMTLVGYDMEIVDFTPRQLSGFPTYDGAATPIPLDATIKVSLSKPSH